MHSKNLWKRSSESYYRINVYLTEFSLGCNFFVQGNVRQPVLKKKNSEFKPVKLCLEIDLVSYAVCAEGLLYIYIYILERERERDSEKMFQNIQYHL